MALIFIFIEANFQLPLAICIKYYSTGADIWGYNLYGNAWVCHFGTFMIWCLHLHTTDHSSV